MGPDLTGLEYSYLKVLRVGDTRTNSGKRRWLCLCTNCGKTFERTTTDIRHSMDRGWQASCGCVPRKTEGHPVHGFARTRPYRVWSGMRSRCYRPNDASYHNYGARGIKVCDRWLDSFENFWEDMGPTYEEGKQIDRIDSNGDYTPENCRWATPTENIRNRRTTRFCDSPLGYMTVGELSERTGIAYATLLYRVNQHWPKEELLREEVMGKPVRKRKSSPRKRKD